MGGLFLLACAALSTVGCGNNQDSSTSSAPSSSPSQAAANVTTSTASALDSAVFDVRYDDGYSYAVSVSVASLQQNVAAASPGFKKVALGNARGTVTNTTPGHIAPGGLEFTIIIAIPSSTSKTGFLDGYFLGMLALSDSRSMSPGASVKYAVDRQYGDNSFGVPEDVDIGKFYWAVTLNGSPPRMIRGGWHSVGGLPIAQAPKSNTRGSNLCDRGSSAPQPCDANGN